MKSRGFINKYLLFGQSRIIKGTPREDIAHFLRSVFPVTTEHALIRIGGDSDGGYLVPDDLTGIRTCFSPGVSNNAGFEEALAARGIRSFMADYSVEGPPVKNPLFHFEKKYLGSRNDEILTTLPAWVERNAPDEKDMVLQMDIEGAEYAVLLSTQPEVLRRFRIIIIEFHGIDTVAEKRGLDLIGLAFEKLLMDFDVAHAHVNNCSEVISYAGFDLPPVMEFTFHRKDRSQSRKPTLRFPHPLDQACVPGRKDIQLPSCWHASR
jgi:hypothetical protein